MLAQPSTVEIEASHGRAHAPHPVLAGVRCRDTLMQRGALSRSVRSASARGQLRAKPRGSLLRGKVENPLAISPPPPQHRCHTASGGDVRCDGETGKAGRRTGGLASGGVRPCRHGTRPAIAAPRGGAALLPRQGREADLPRAQDARGDGADARPANAPRVWDERTHRVRAHGLRRRRARLRGRRDLRECPGSVSGSVTRAAGRVMPAAHSRPPTYDGLHTGDRVRPPGPAAASPPDPGRSERLSGSPCGTRARTGSSVMGKHDVRTHVVGNDDWRRRQRAVLSSQEVATWPESWFPWC